MTLHEEPLVSVLTPVYNGADFLAECIESVLSQTYGNYEYIIVNNCSTDGTLEIATRYAQKDRRIRVLTNEKFVGVIENHNIAFSLISKEAKYCKVVSADDFIFPDCIREMVELAERNPSAGIVGSYQLSGSYIRWQGFQYPTEVFAGRDLCRRLLLLRTVKLNGQAISGFGTPTSILYRADLIRSSGGRFYPNSSPHADTSACFKYLEKCDYGFVYKVLSYERTHEATQSWRSGEINRYLSAVLNDRIQYGPLYLEKKEAERKVKEGVQAYYTFLAVSYCTGRREKEFWDYHKGRLKELGYPVKPVMLLKAAVVKALQEVVNPEQAVRKAWRRVFGKPRSGGAGAVAGNKTTSVMLNN